MDLLIGHAGGLLQADYTVNSRCAAPRDLALQNADNQPTAVGFSTRYCEVPPVTGAYVGPRQTPIPASMSSHATAALRRRTWRRTNTGSALEVMSIEPEVDSGRYRCD